MEDGADVVVRGFCLGLPPLALYWPKRGGRAMLSHVEVSGFFGSLGNQISFGGYLH